MPSVITAVLSECESLERTMILGVDTAQRRKISLTYEAQKYNSVPDERSVGWWGALGLPVRSGLPKLIDS